MPRLAQPEKLDSLDATDPDAQASRRDLVKINRWMGNFAWFEKILDRQCSGWKHFLEMGAGGGELAMRLIQKSRCATYTAVDRMPMPDNWPQSARWHQGDLFQYTEYTTAEVLLANLVLHHFDDNELSRIGDLIQQSSIAKIVVNEPCRRSFHKFQLRAGKLIGFNHITLYDGSVSIDAGFRANELPELLGLAPTRWHWRIEETLMGAYRMIAERA